MSEAVLSTKAYSDLSRDELYDLLALRTDIFVVEQNCAYPELDYYDQASVHFLMKNEKAIIAYARLAPGESIYKQPSIGRIAVRKEHRGKGVAKKLFEAVLREALNRYPKQDLKLQAQTYLAEFYGGYGFDVASKAYPDFGIMHVDMIRKARED